MFFDPSKFVQRGCCGEWIDFFKVLYVSSNILICASYLFIAITLFHIVFFDKNLKRFIKRATEDRVQKSLIVYGLFILFCGLGHLEGAFSFLFPVYHFFSVWTFLTAIISFYSLVYTLELRAMVEPPIIKD